MPVVCPKNYGSCGVDIVYDPDRLFVLMPFSESIAPQSLFFDVLQPLPGWNVHRADSDLSKPEIWCKICTNIQSSRAVIADLSGSNPNVFLELGLTWGFGKPFILLTQDIDDLPFDTRSFHVIKYVRNNSEIDNPDKIRADILEVLKALPPISSEYTLSVMPSSDSTARSMITKDKDVHDIERTYQKSRGRKLRTRINDETTFEVDIPDLSSALTAVKEIDTMKKLYELNQIVDKLRVICETEDGVIYFPLDNQEMTQAKQLTLTSAASFPVGVPIEFLITKVEMTRSSISAYCSSKNTPTSRYLKIEENQVHINSEGIEWIFNLLKHDGLLSDE